MIEINQTLFINILLIIIFINSICAIIMGIVNHGEPKKYGFGDVVSGTIWMIIIIIIVLI